MRLFRPLFILGALAELGLSQDCPILGPAYPEVTNPSSSAAFSTARAAIEAIINEGITSGQLDNGTYFSIQVFSRHSDKTLYEHYYGPGVGPDTLYRVASISKLISVYTTLAELGDDHWNDPVTKHIPELARMKVRNPVYDVDWSTVTLGALASHMGGIPRDYALGDLAPYLQQGLPGLSVLTETEQIQCGSVDMRPCTREESFAKIDRAFPIAASQHTPAYSNMAFQLLGYAVAKITGKAFPKLVEKKLLKPLKLSRTFLVRPGNDSNAVAVQGWDWDFGDEAPGAGYISSASDLTKLGRSILASTLLPPATTRAWLKPTTHTARRALSIGRPWEINRPAVPISTSPSSSSSSSSTTTRVIDQYTKLGSIGQYMSLLALSPDHGVGYTLLIGGAGAGATYAFLQGRMDEVWLAAGEQAGRDAAAALYAGNYTLSDDSVAEVLVRADEPGLFLNRLRSNGTDIMAVLGPVSGVPAGMELGVWLYPMGLAGDGKVAFRAAMGVRGVPAGESCASWGSLDLMRYGGYPLDLVVFELGRDGKAVTVELPVLKKTLRRDGKVW